MNWIKCSDRMPDLNVYVVILGNENKNNIYRNIRVAYLDHRWGNFVGVDNGIYDAKYWMPLPSPPEDK